MEFCHGSWCMCKEWQLEEVKTLVFFEGRQQQSDLQCPGKLLRRGHHCLSAYLHCCQQHSSQESPTKSLATLFQSPSSTDANPGGKVVNKVIILCLLFGFPAAARFDKLVEAQVSWASWPSTIKTPGWCRKLKNLYLGCQLYTIIVHNLYAFSSIISYNYSINSYTPHNLHTLNQFVQQTMKLFNCVRIIRYGLEASAWQTHYTEGNQHLMVRLY